VSAGVKKDGEAAQAPELLESEGPVGRPQPWGASSVRARRDQDRPNRVGAQGLGAECIYIWIYMDIYIHVYMHWV